MAKRKRLGPVDPVKPALETKSAFSGNGAGFSAPCAPIAQVTGDAAASAALAEVADEMVQARSDGRMVLELPLAAVAPDYLVRDRLVSDPEDMQSLIESIRLRGQQTPIEVVDLQDGRYGLISGLRRYAALKQLATEGLCRPVLALMRRPNDVADAYLAMVEENEIRAGLSYYERAAVAAAAVDKGVFDTEKAALLHIYRSASRSKRSKIRSFLTVVRHLEGALVYPVAIGERMGLALAKHLEADPDAGKALRISLMRSPPHTVEEEAKRINAMLSDPKNASGPPPSRRSTPSTSPARLPDGVRIKTHANGAVTLAGPGMTPALRQKLFDWLRRQK